VFQTVYTHKNGILRVKVQLLYKKISIAPLAKMTKIRIGDFRRIGRIVDYLFHFMLYLMLFKEVRMNKY